MASRVSESLKLERWVRELDVTEEYERLRHA